MQIFPDLPSNSSWNKADSKNNARDSFGFTQLFADEFYSAAEITPSIETTFLSEDMFITNDPYEEEKPKADSSSLQTQIPLEEVYFTDDEIKKIVSALENTGADIDGLNSLLGAIHGINIKDIIKAVAQGKPVNLAENDMAQIQNMLLNLDGSGELGNGVLSSIRQGKSLQAWSLFSDALNNQNVNDVFSVSRENMMSLGKALGLSQSSLDAIYKSFGGNKELLLTTDGIKQLLVPLQQEMTNKLDAQNKLASQLDEILKPVINEARKRMETEAAAESHEAKKVQQSKIIILDTVLQKNQENTQAVNAKGMNDVANEEKGLLNQIRGQEKNSSSETGNVSQQILKDKDNPQQFKDGSDSFDRQQKDKKDSFDNTKLDNKVSGLASKDGSSNNPWDMLLQRLDFSQAMNPGVSAQAATQQNRSQPVGWDRLTSNFFSEVEQGAFSTLRNGTSRLELQINTAELGVVNILLTTKNGEVSALLRPERPETTSLLMEKIDALRLELEQQALKVDKVEVQTQLNDGQNMHWQGTDQHNAFQQQQARTRDLERLRLLGKVRQNTLTIESSLAHKLQDRSITAGDTDRLNIVA